MGDVGLLEVIGAVVVGDEVFKLFGAEADKVGDNHWDEDCTGSFVEREGLIPMRIQEPGRKPSAITSIQPRIENYLRMI